MKRTVWILIFLALLINTNAYSYPYAGVKRYYIGTIDHGGSAPWKYNNDEIVDLLIVNDTDPLVMGVLIGIGEGEFGPYLSLDIEIGEYSWIRDVEVVDYPPRDGLDDILVAHNSNYFTICRNNGDGSWNIEHSSDFGNPVHGFPGTYDCDGDQEKDIVILLDYPNPQFSIVNSASENISIAIPDASYPFPLADFNGDGLTDITVTENMNGSNLITFWGFEDCTYYESLSLPFGHQRWGKDASYSIGDFNNDGCDDFVNACEEYSWPLYISVTYGSENGLTGYVKYSWTNDVYHTVFTSDADCNGYEDIGVVDTRFVSTENELPVYFHFSESGMIDASCDTLVFPTEQSSRFYSSDLNGDNYDDLRYFPTDDSIGILINLGPVSTLLASASIEIRDGSRVLLDWILSCNSCKLEEFRIYRSDTQESELVAVIDYVVGETKYNYIDDVSIMLGEELNYSVYGLSSDQTQTLLTEQCVIVPRADTWLYPNYPNPFNPGTTIAFEFSNPGQVWLDVFDVSGRQVASVIQGQNYPSGRHEVTWIGKDMRGELLASGVYYCRLRTDKITLKQKILIIR